VLEKFGRLPVLKDVPVPKLEKGDALVRVLYCGICGRGLKIFEGLFPP